MKIILPSKGALIWALVSRWPMARLKSYKTLSAQMIVFSFGVGNWKSYISFGKFANEL
jgi:hypothetical protein